MRTRGVQPGQVRKLVRLVAETAEVAVGERAWFALSGMRKILGAITAGAVTDCDFAPGSRGAFTTVTLDGWDAMTIGAVSSVAQSGSAFHPGVRALMSACPMRPGALLTGTRAMLVDDRTWYASPYVEQYVLPANIDDGIFSSLRNSPASVVQGLGFYRGRGDRPFTESDRALVELFHAECGNLLWPTPQALTEVQKSQLAPRQRQTLELLLEGCSDKEVAARLSISPLTVNQYNKAIFRRFGVQSRAALLAKLVRAPRTERR